jgi:hypothetical protein
MGVCHGDGSNGSAQQRTTERYSSLHDSLYAYDLHAKRVDALAAATLGGHDRRSPSR